MDNQTKVQWCAALVIHYGLRFFWKFMLFILTTALFHALLKSCGWNPFERLPNAPW